MPGLLGKKIGMTSVFSAEGKNVPCTVIEVGPCVVTQVKSVEKDGYSAVQLGYEEAKEKNTSAPLMGHFKKAGVTPKRHLAEFTGFEQELNLGDTLTVELIAPEVFRGDDISALKIGDSIYIGGREVTVESLPYNDDFCSTVFINSEDLFLFMNRNGDYTVMANEDDYAWNAFAVIECPVKDSLLFLDYIDDETGDSLTLPIIHTAKELTEQLMTADASEVYTVGLATNNV